MKNCNDCKWVNITEDGQTDKRVNHKCLKHNVRLFHRSNNPKIEHNYIFPHERCDEKDFEQR